MVSRLLGQSDVPLPRLRNRQDLIEPLDLLDRSLRAANAQIIADTDLKPLRVQAGVFGLHAAHLDIRQFSEVHTAVLDEIFRKLGWIAEFGKLADPERAEVLTACFDRPAPDLSGLVDLSELARESLALFEMLARTVECYGREALGTYVISMTRGPADVLAVVLLAYWSGLCLSERGPALSFTPLFETRGDLQESAAIMGELFQNPVYARHLEAANLEKMVIIG